LRKLHSLVYGNLLQGRYEAERLPKDFSPDRIVPDFAFNVLIPLGLLYRPVVDEDCLANGGKKPIWPNGKRFAVCLTHDVDTVSLYSLKQLLRARRGHISKANDGIHKLKECFGICTDLAKAGIYARQKDPIHCYERWMEVEKKVGAHSTFFFWPGWSNVRKHHHTDCSYELSDRVVFDGVKCIVREMIKEIDRRGWEIGLHPSWYSFNDADELRIQKEVIEKVLGHEILSVRQHYLHYDIRCTPRAHSQAGFKYDSTLGFNDNIGFRFGTCYPWHLFDLRIGKDLEILEIPLVVQDGAMLSPTKGMRLDEETAFQYIIQLTEAVEDVGGVLTLLWHPNDIIKRNYWNLYLKSLKYLKEKMAWFASVKEVGGWWKSARSKG